MSQFDSLIIFPLLWSLIVVLIVYYNMSIKILIPDFFGTKKFRGKKIGLSGFYRFFDNNSEIKAASSVSAAL